MSRCRDCRKRYAQEMGLCRTCQKERLTVRSDRGQPIRCPQVALRPPHTRCTRDNGHVGEHFYG
jgi:predicted amidophosphoribosyltransferase